MLYVPSRYKRIKWDCLPWGNLSCPAGGFPASSPCRWDPDSEGIQRLTLSGRRRNESGPRWNIKTQCKKYYTSSYGKIVRSLLFTGAQGGLFASIFASCFTLMLLPDME